MKMYDIASRMAGFLACQTGLEQSRVDAVRYGLEIILGEFIKWAILIVVSAVLGILPGALFAMVSMAVFRMVSGGAHCQDYWRCLTFGLILFLGSGKVGVYLAPYISQPLMSKAIAVGSLVMAVLVLYWAPGEVVYRKIEYEERALFKKLSFLCLALWSGITVLFIVPYSVPVAVAGFLSMLVQSLSYTPAGYRLIDAFDIVLSRIMGERRCSHA